MYLRKKICLVLMMTITTNSFSSNLINHKEVVDAAKLISLKGDPSASNNLLISIPDGKKYKDTINYLEALESFYSWKLYPV